MTTLIIDGNKRPFVFNNRVARTYEQTTGKPYLAACYEYQNLMQSVFEANQRGEDMVSAVSGVSITLLSDMAFAGFSYGHQAAGQAVDFTADDVAEWLLDNEGALLTVATEILNGILVKRKEGDEDTKKKKTAKKPPLN